jgi:hypothetical protein
VSDLWERVLADIQDEDNEFRATDAAIDACKRVVDACKHCVGDEERMVAFIEDDGAIELVVQPFDRRVTIPIGANGHIYFAKATGNSAGPEDPVPPDAVELVEWAMRSRRTKKEDQP